MKPGETFISPTGPYGRFPERTMRVISTSVIMGIHWIDAEPVRPLPTDEYTHSTYMLGDDGRPLPVTDPLL